MPFINKKKKREAIERNEKASGIILQGNPRMDRKKGKLFLCLMNGILLFALMEGTVGCFVSAFELPANMVLFTAIHFILCMAYGMLYYNQIIKVIGYLAVILTFSFGIIRYRFVVRSGFASIANIFMAYIEDALDLPVQREYTEYYPRGEYAVTMCLIFMVLAAGLMFNIVLSEVKGSLFLFLLTFPIVQMGIYFDENINLVYFSLYAIAIVIISLFRTTPHYKLETKKKKGYSEKISASGREYNYVTDGRTSMKIMLSFGAFILAVAAVMAAVIPQSSFTMSTKYDDLKDDTEEFAKKVALVGFYGMLFDKGGTGGVSRGRMGDSKYVRYDFQTDLILMVPNTEQIGDLYFKGYVGSMYEDNQWKTFEETGKDLGEVIPESTDYNLPLHIYQYSDYSEYETWNIRLVNVRANTSYPYQSYYIYNQESLYSDMAQEDNPKGKFEINTILTGAYKWWNPSITYREAKRMVKDIWEQYDSTTLSKLAQMSAEWREREERYRQFVYHNYLDVPKENQEVIDRIIREEGLDREEDAVEGIKNYLQNNYEYTLIPGKTPRDRDFVNYFLTENKKGYCTYFASSAVLMLRQLGIPARFVGGYYVSRADIESEGELQMLPEQDWLLYYGSEQEIEVYEVEVTDSSAHAWVEVYVDGFGWIPVDVTPPGEDDEMDEIAQEQGQGTIAKFITTLFSQETADNVKNTVIMALLAVGITALAFSVLYQVVGCILVLYRKKKYASPDCPRETIFQIALYLFRIFKFHGCRREETDTFHEYRALLEEKGMIDKQDGERIFAIYEKAKYSPENITAEESREFAERIYKVRASLYASMKWHRKFVFRYVLLL